MNFVIELSNSKKFNVIYIIIDRLFKKRHYVSCTIIEKYINVNACVRILIHYVFKIHEVFLSIILNRKFQFVILI